ncbi:uncharacterized protein ColSpa_08431 [Colletotrichum spaethianum]|uniref:SCP domain-containing protein n=1 Tax=Colletotrichum spaethianum TaxID=700344 RepID=A0AA37P9T0_9PEZI|nr:uncharacterized protein ColSpa_08431 [Colletotrichum spaethianum]GKT48250.1 hypothetical protein ColSpa_08431 [Colletotrichum spaethianum]
MLAKVIMTAAAAGFITMDVHAATLTSDQAQSLKTINDARVIAGVPALVWDTNLQNDATGWAEMIAAVGRLEPAPYSWRKGAGDALAFFHALDADNTVLRSPLSEAAKLWLDSDDAATTSIHYHTLHRHGKFHPLISIKATQIGCAAANGIDDKGAKDPLRVFTVCRVFKDINEPSVPALRPLELKLGSQSNLHPFCDRQILIKGIKGETTVAVTENRTGLQSAA